MSRTVKEKKVQNDVVGISRIQSVDGKDIRVKLTWQWYPEGGSPQITIYRLLAGMVAGDHFHSVKDPS